jgi:hypothetical protein
MRMSFGLLQVTLPFTYSRGKTIYYQRAVPTDLRDRYTGKLIKHDLRTADWSRAAPMVAKLNKRYESEWEGLRSDPAASPKALRVHADALLREFGLSPSNPKNDPVAEDVFLERLKEKLEAFAGDDREAYDSAESSEYLTPVEAEALRRLQGKNLPTLSDALELHLDIHPKRDDAKFVAYQRRAFDGLLLATGDKAIASFTRDDARTYIDTQLADKKATGTVERRLGVMRAVFTTWRLEKAPNMANPFEKLTVPNAGKDKQSRIPFTTAQLVSLDKACRDKDDDLRWMLAILMDSGARLAEVVGLALDDIKLDAPVPHIVIQPCAPCGCLTVGGATRGSQEGAKAGLRLPPLHQRHRMQSHPRLQHLGQLAQAQSPRPCGPRTATHDGRQAAGCRVPQGHPVCH